VPERNVVQPPPNRFTHELLVEEPYRLDRPQRADEPDRVMPSGTRVVLLVEGSCRTRERQRVMPISLNTSWWPFTTCSLTSPTPRT
jgi:hypothetical protein